MFSGKIALAALLLLASGLTMFLGVSKIVFPRQKYSTVFFSESNEVDISHIMPSISHISDKVSSSDTCSRSDQSEVAVLVAAMAPPPSYPSRIAYARKRSLMCIHTHTPTPFIPLGTGSEYVCADRGKRGLYKHIKNAWIRKFCWFSRSKCLHLFGEMHSKYVCPCFVDSFSPLPSPQYANHDLNTCTILS